MTPRRHLCVLLALAACTAAQAHRLDEYLQSTTIRVTADKVAVHLRLVPGVGVAGQLWQAIDADGSGELSEAERQAYVARVLNDLSLTVDGRAAAMEIVNVSFPSQADAMRGLGQIGLSLGTAVASKAGPHHLHFASRHRPVASVYLVNTLLPVDAALRITGQQRSADQAVYDLDYQVD